jgi:hypothetical protein
MGTGADVASVVEEGRCLLGDVANHGKLYLLTKLGIQQQNAINHLRLYNAFGDPTQELWADNPIQLPPLKDIEVRCRTSTRRTPGSRFCSRRAWTVRWVAGCERLGTDGSSGAPAQAVG